MKINNIIDSNQKQSVLPMLIQDYLDICDPVLTFDRFMGEIEGAIQAGCQAVWINLSGKNLNSFTEASVLPTLEINHLTELLTL